MSTATETLHTLTVVYFGGLTSRVTMCTEAEVAERIAAYTEIAARNGQTIVSTTTVAE